MRHFRFAEFENFPLDQEVLKDMQDNAFAGVEAFCKSLHSTQPFVLGGCDVTDIGAGYFNVSAGLIFDPSVGQIFTFQGATEIEKGTTPGSVIKFNQNVEILETEDSGEELITNNQAEIELVSSPVSSQRWENIVTVKWYHLLAQNTPGEWESFSFSGSGFPGEYLEGKINPLTGIITIRGARKHFNLTTSANPMQMGYGTIPLKFRPSKTIYFQTGFDTHAVPPKREVSGGLYLGDSGMILPDGTLSISQRRLDLDTSPDFLHHFQISYQK